MSRNRRCATIVGALYIVGTVAGVLSVVFTGPVQGAQDYLIALPAHENQLIIGALLVLTMGLALAMVPVVAFRILREHNEVLALGYLVFRGALETVTYIVTVIGWLSLLRLSRAYGEAGAPEGRSFQALATLLLEGEVIASVTTIVFIVGAVMFYYLLYHSRLIPRWISEWGLLSSIPYLAAGLLVVFGLIGHMSTIDAVLRIPLGIQEMLLAVWLIVKGFNPSAVASTTAR